MPDYTDEDMDELRKLMIGKKVVKIDEMNDYEGIAQFTMDDGTIFCLYSTEIGFWIELGLEKKRGE
jgi:hypothetical protein